MSHFAARATHFYENFWNLVQPYHPFVQRLSAEASHVGNMGGMKDSLRTVVGGIAQNFKYDSDEHLWGEEDYWASASETVTKGAGDCDCLSLLGSSVLFSMGVPHYLTIGHLAEQIRGLEATPEYAPGHVWLEVDDKESTYLLEFTRPMVYVMEKGNYQGVPYVPVERIKVQ
jgi:predicted transglutaminase-like cysteine proteinase